MVVLFQYTCPFKHGGPTWESCRTHFTNLIRLYFYPKILVCIFAPSVFTNQFVHYIHSYLPLFQNGICYRIVLFPSLHLINLNTIILRLPCNRVHCLLVTTICVSLLHFQQTYAFRRKKTWQR